VTARPGGFGWPQVFWPVMGGAAGWARGHAGALSVPGGVAAADVAAAEGARLRVLIVPKAQAGRMLMFELEGNLTCVDTQGATHGTGARVIRLHAISVHLRIGARFTQGPGFLSMPGPSLCRSVRWSAGRTGFGPRWGNGMSRIPASIGDCGSVGAMVRRCSPPKAARGMSVKEEGLAAMLVGCTRPGAGSP
jgi:hypothetical protein